MPLTISALFEVSDGGAVGVAVDVEAGRDGAGCRIDNPAIDSVDGFESLSGSYSNVDASSAFEHRTDREAELRCTVIDSGSKLGIET